MEGGLLCPPFYVLRIRPLAEGFKTVLPHKIDALTCRAVSWILWATPMRLSISRTLVIVFLIVSTISAVTIGVVGHLIQQRSVEALALGESRRYAELLFHNLSSVMQKGWSKDEIAELIQQVNQANPDVVVAVHRSDVVVKDFGDIEADRLARTADPLIREVMDNGQERLTQRDETLRFIYPIMVGDVCVHCHVSARVGDVNGVIDIRIPVDNLRVPLDYTMKNIFIVFAFLIFVLFLATISIIRYLVAKPMTGLARVIDGIVESGNLSRRIDGRSFRWLAEVRSVASNFNRLMEQLEESRNELLLQSSTDPLTGLSNRRQFNELLLRESDVARQNKGVLSLIMIDLDGFKPINDRYGHATGDAMLRRAAAAMVGQVGVRDTVARLGGDEFMVLSPGTDLDGAMVLAQKLVDAIEGEGVSVGGERVCVGASVGVGCYPCHADTIDAVFQVADGAMYANKEARKKG